MAIIQKAFGGNSIKTSGTVNLTVIPAGSLVVAAGDTIFVALSFDNLTATTPTVSTTWNRASGSDLVPPTGVLIAQADSPQAAGAGGVITQLWRFDYPSAGFTSLVPTFSAAVAAKAGSWALFSGVGTLSGTPQAGTSPRNSGTGGPGSMLIQAVGTEDNSGATFVSGINTTGSSVNNTSGGSGTTNAAATLGWTTAAGGVNTNQSQAWTITDGGLITAVFNAAPITWQAAVTIPIVSGFTAQGLLGGEPRYYETFWDTVGSPVDTNQSSKDLVDIPVTSGALLMAVGIGMRDDGGIQDVATMIGATTSAWTKIEPSFTDGNDPAVVGAWATATSTGLLDIRVYVGTDAVTERPMGVALWVLDPGQWSGTPTWSPSFGFQSDANGTVPVSPPAGAYVFYAGSDPNNGLVGALPTPADGNVHHSEDLLGPYSIWLASWMNANASTYGPDNLSGYDVTGVSLWVQKAASGPVTHTGAVTFAATSGYTASGIKRVSAAVTTPITSAYSASGGAALSASVTTAITSGYSASGIKAAVASSTTPIISTVGTSGTAFKRVTAVSTIPIISTHVGDGFKVAFGAVTTSIVSAYSAEGDVVSGSTTHTGSVTFNIVSTVQAATATVAKIAAVTTPIVSGYSASGIGRFNASSSTPIISAMIAQGNKMVFGSTTIPIVSTQTTAAGTVITQAASSTSIISTVTPANGSVIPGPASSITAIISTTPAVNATRVVLASVTFVSTSSMTVAAPSAIFAGASTTAIVSTTPAPTSIRLAIASVSTPIVSTFAGSGFGIFQAQTNLTNIVSGYAANGNIPGSASSITPIVSTYAANGFVIRQAAVTIAIISTMSANAIGKFMASSTTAIVSTTVTSGIRAAVAAGTTPITSTYEASGRGMYMGSTTTPIVSTFLTSAGEPPTGGVEISIISTYNADGFVIRQAAVTTAIVTTYVAAGTKAVIASSTTPIISTYIGSGVKRVSASVTTAIVSTFVAQGNGIFRASSITSIVSDMMVEGSRVAFGGVLIPIVSTYSSFFATEDLIKRLHPTVLVELTWANELKELTTPNKLTELTGKSTLKDVVI